MEPTVDLVALKAFPYAGLTLKTGDAFSAIVKDANTLTLLGHARVARPPAVPKPTRTRAITPKPAKATPDREYGRRDLVAEGTGE